MSLVRVGGGGTGEVAVESSEGGLVRGDVSLVRWLADGVSVLGLGVSLLYLGRCPVT